MPIILCIILLCCETLWSGLHYYLIIVVHVHVIEYTTIIHYVTQIILYLVSARACYIAIKFCDVDHMHVHTHTLFP